MSRKQFVTQNLLVRNDSVLVVIDVQEKLMPVIADGVKLIDNIITLLKFSQIIKLPVILTEQDKLGATIAEVRSEILNFNPISKIVFDGFLCDEFVEHLSQMERKTLILAGVEAHICIAQTALHALHHFKVHVVGDAVSSRTLENRNLALERMRQSGAVISSTETVIYELLQRAGTDEFRAALKLVK
jgi:nicotinamidase-related amidase